MSMSTPNRVPSELNWVAARAACNLAAVFNLLRIGVEGDILEANKATGGAGPFALSPTNENRTLVIAQQDVVGPRVIFNLQDTCIEAKDESQKKTIRVTVGLNDQGCCVLRLDDGTELEQWQFRKRALESLFFGGQQ